jgi:hypothetical protein
MFEKKKTDQLALLRTVVDVSIGLLWLLFPRSILWSTSIRGRARSVSSTEVAFCQYHMPWGFRAKRTASQVVMQGQRPWVIPKMVLLVCILWFMTLNGLVPSASAQPGVPTNTSAPPSSSGAGAVKAKTFLSDFEFWLSAEILLFGLGVVVIEFLLLRKARVTAEEALRVYAVTLIIVGTLFAITAGFDSNQIAPAMGLFGTIAGYLLGKRSSMSEKPEKQKGDEP